ncbi:MAG: cation:proton antiporter [Kribbellaceae bacterium]
MNLTPPGFESLVIVVVVAAFAPIIVDLLPGRVRLPQVVLLLVAGILVGPSVAGWAKADPVSMFSSIGLGFLFLLAGYELDLALFRERAGRLAGMSWLVSLAGAAALLAGLYSVGVVHSPLVMAIAVTTTALGTLLPILRDNDMLGGRFGRYVFASGAVGELGPIVAMALFLGASGTLIEAVSLVVFLLVAYAVAVLPNRVRTTRIGEIIRRREHATSQTTLRLSIALLFLLLLAASDEGFDNVLGAFVAGMVLRRWSPGQIDLLEAKLDAVGYGFFIPIFFVYSGMTLDIDAIIANPVPMLVVFVVILVVRGLPALFWYRNDLPRNERLQMVFLTATTLPLLVALTSIGVANGTMTTSAQASAIGAGVLTVLVFPIVAVGLRQRQSADPESGSEPSDRPTKPPEHS